MHYDIGDVFDLTEAHLKLIRNMCFNFDNSGYDGSPCVDLKRPYGNSGDVAYEVYRVLYDEYWDYGEEDREMPQVFHDALTKLHKESAIALQIFALYAKMEPGRFKKTFYGSLEWEKIE
jgi:hypothetical protein